MKTKRTGPTRAVWKQVIYPNSVKDKECLIEVPAPVGAKPLRVMTQNGSVCVWFECDPDAKMGVLNLYCVGTGFGKVCEDRDYLDTVIDGDYVWHFYH